MKGQIQNGVDTFTDAIAGLIVLAIIWMRYSGQLGEEGTDEIMQNFSTIIAIVVVIFCSWLVKTFTGLITRPMDAVKEKSEQ